MVLGLATHIGEGQPQSIGHQCTLCDGTCSYTCYGFGLGEVLEDGACELHLDKGTKVGEGKRLAVVAIEGALPAAGPCEGVGGLKLDGLYVQQLGCKDRFQCIHCVLCVWFVLRAKLRKSSHTSPHNSLLIMQGPHLRAQKRGREPACSLPLVDVTCSRGCWYSLLR